MEAESQKNILDYWFGSLEDGFATETKQKIWYAFDPEIDRFIRQTYGSLVEKLAQGELLEWLENPEGCMAYILLADQFPRNIYRGTSKAFALDPQALAAARTGVLSGFDRLLKFEQRGFFYMPFEHSENLLDQHLCVGLFSQLRDETPAGKRDLTGNALRFAHKHREIIQRFGRFPHRNDVLERESTTEEIEYLKDASKYGQ